MIRSFAVVHNGPTVRAPRRDCRRVVRFRVDYTLAPAENGARRRFQNQIAKELKRRFNILTARSRKLHEKGGGYRTGKNARPKGDRPDFGPGSSLASG